MLLRLTKPQEPLDTNFQNSFLYFKNETEINKFEVSVINFTAMNTQAGIIDFEYSQAA